MPKMKLTAPAVERIKPPTDGQVDYFDKAFPAFVLRVGKSGRKSWAIFYRYHGRLRRMTLGAYPVLSLAEARAKAREALQELDRGCDPASTRAQEKSRGVETVRSVVETFIERHSKKHNRSWRETERLFEKEVLPAWGKRPIDSITRRDTIELLDEIMDRGTPYLANRVLAAVRKLFNWSVERDIVQHSPADRVKAPGREIKRDRILTAHEIKAC
jgi:hypothetical protein